MGSKMRVPSRDNARPAPREIHTENPSRLSAFSRGSAACFHLEAGISLSFTWEGDQLRLPSKDEESDMYTMEQDDPEKVAPCQRIGERFFLTDSHGICCSTFVGPRIKRVVCVTMLSRFCLSQRGCREGENNAKGSRCLCRKLMIECHEIGKLFLKKPSRTRAPSRLCSSWLRNYG